MTINERIKYLRKNIFCLSQAELAEKLGISQTAVAGIERKHGIVSEQTIKFFCLLYSVNEEWLRNGGDKIFSDSDNLNAFIKIISSRTNRRFLACTCCPVRMELA